MNLISSAGHLFPLGVSREFLSVDISGRVDGPKLVFVGSYLLKIAGRFLFEPLSSSEKVLRNLGAFAVGFVSKDVEIAVRIKSDFLSLAVQLIPYSVLVVFGLGALSPPDRSIQANNKGNSLVIDGNFLALLITDLLPLWPFTLNILPLVDVVTLLIDYVHIAFIVGSDV